MIIDNKSEEKKLSVYQHVFLLSHMRANTSLIGHILGSHPQICGYYEMHLSYHSENALAKQQQLLLLNKDLHKEKNNTSCHYLFDKILHNNYAFLLDKLIPESRTKPPTKIIKILVSIRAAEQSIKSIIKLFRNKKSAQHYSDPEAATEYYIKRLGKLAEFCQQYKHHYYYYDADLIRENPEKLLVHIQNWLSLTTPLSEQYRIFSLTGKPRIGDSSENMKKGRIVKQQTNYDDIEIPSHLVLKAVTKSKQYRQLIISHAIDSITF